MLSSKVEALAAKQGTEDSKDSKSDPASAVSSSEGNDYASASKASDKTDYTAEADIEKQRIWVEAYDSVAKRMTAVTQSSMQEKSASSSVGTQAVGLDGVLSTQNVVTMEDDTITTTEFSELGGAANPADPDQASGRKSQ